MDWVLPRPPRDPVVYRPAREGVVMDFDLDLPNGALHLPQHPAVRIHATLQICRPRPHVLVEATAIQL